MALAGASTDLTLPPDYTPPDVPSTALAGASTTDPETVLASTYQHFKFDFRDMAAIVGAKTLDVQRQFKALASKGDAINVAEMFQMQMAMNQLSQLSEMSSSVMSAANTSIASMARNVKG
jgi:hypothetical protein